MQAEGFQAMNKHGSKDVGFLKRDKHMPSKTDGAFERLGE